MKLVVLIVTILVINFNGGANKQAANRSPVQIKILSNKKSFNQAEPISFELLNKSNKKIWVMVGYQIKRQVWEDSLEDAVNDPRRKEQVLFVLQPHQKRKSATYDNTGLIAEQHKNAKFLLTTKKDSLVRSVANDMLKKIFMPNPVRLIAKYGTDANGLSNRTYSAEFNYQN